MPRKIYCPVCPRLQNVREQYPAIGALGAPGKEADRQVMRRIYRRERGTKAYQAIGNICDYGHVVLDRIEGSAHTLTPTEPARVVCRSTGEVVSADRA